MSDSAQPAVGVKPVDAEVSADAPQQQVAEEVKSPSEEVESKTEQVTEGAADEVAEGEAAEVTDDVEPDTHPDCDPVALANQLEQLMDSNQPEEAAEIFLTDDSVMTTPAVFGTSTFTGKEKVLAKWQKDLKDGLKFVAREPFAEIAPGVAQRKGTVSVLMYMKLAIQQTITFSPEGKIERLVAKRP